MSNDQKKAAAQAIVNIFETGRILGDYGAVTLIAGDSGHLTYGRSQTTLASGNLFLLIKSYCEAPGAQFAPVLKPYLARLADRDTTLDQDGVFRSLLHRAGDDSSMRTEQDAFFERVYWDPASTTAARLGIGTGLGGAVVYDSYIHGSFSRMRERTDEAVGSSRQATEKNWVMAYVSIRREWLAGSRPPLSKTVYRMDAFRELIQANNWELALPVTVLGHVISEASLTRVTRASAEPANLRILRLVEPNLNGADVIALQNALVDLGFELKVDGELGAETHAAVLAFQAREGLRTDGGVGPVTRAALGLD